MKMRIFALAIALFAIAITWQASDGQHLIKRHHQPPPTCEPGFKIVEEVIYQEVERFVCKMVPETKKKWVYDWVDDPFCIQNTKHGDCPQCCGPYCRKQLVKRQIDEPCPTLKCVTERIVETVPVVIYKKVPCDAAPAAPKSPLFMPPAVNGKAPEPVAAPKPMPKVQAK